MVLFDNEPPGYMDSNFLSPQNFYTQEDRALDEKDRVEGFKPSSGYKVKYNQSFGCDLCALMPKFRNRVF